MESNNEFLLYLYKITDMGYKSTKTLVDIIKDKENKIITLLYEELDEYETSLNKVKKLLEERKIKQPMNGILLDISTNAAMHMELMNDNSDVKIAEMLIQGYTMGNIELKKNCNKYKDTMTPEEAKLADEINKYQSKNIKKLKKHL